MINVSISYGLSPESRYFKDEINYDIQLALYKYELYRDNIDAITEKIKSCWNKVKVIHLPINATKFDSDDIFSTMDNLSHLTGCNNFVIHPNKGILEFIEKNSKRNFGTHNLSIETFQWKRKKEIRSPLDIIEVCSKYPECSMTIDTSHIEDVWFDYKIMSHLLKYTSVIHLSNRSSNYGQHLPFNDQRGDINLVGFVKDLKKRYNWSGNIVLEYMPAYSHKLIKNAEYIKKLLG